MPLQKIQGWPVTGCSRATIQALLWLLPSKTFSRLLPTFVFPPLPKAERSLLVAFSANLQPGALPQLDVMYPVSPILFSPLCLWPSHQHPCLSTEDFAFPCAEPHDVPVSLFLQPVRSFQMVAPTSGISPTPPNFVSSSSPWPTSPAGEAKAGVQPRVPLPALPWGAARFQHPCVSAAQALSKQLPQCRDAWRSLFSRRPRSWPTRDLRATIYFASCNLSPFNPACPTQHMDEGCLCNYLSIT